MSMAHQGAAQYDAADEIAVVTLRKRSAHVFERVVVIGGGCYGGWYTRQLLKALSSGALQVREIVVVDRNPACSVLTAQRSGEFGDAPVTVVTQSWADYLTSWLSDDVEALQGHALVPSPLMPHLLLDWLVMRAQARWSARDVRVEPLARPPRMPWERAAPDGRHYVSFAEWLCPINCIEPALCPATGGPRNWSIPPALQAYVEAQRIEHAHGDGDASAPPLRGPLVFHCVHRTHGVGMIDADAVAAADVRIAEWGSAGPVKVLVGTVSHCHGALGVLSA